MVCQRKNLKSRYCIILGESQSSSQISIAMYGSKSQNSGNMFLKCGKCIGMG